MAARQSEPGDVDQRAPKASVGARDGGAGDGKRAGIEQASEGAKQRGRGRGGDRGGTASATQAHDHGGGNAANAGGGSEGGAGATGNQQHAHGGGSGAESASPATAGAHGGHGGGGHSSAPIGTVLHEEWKIGFQGKRELHMTVQTSTYDPDRAARTLAAVKSMFSGVSYDSTERTGSESHRKIPDAMRKEFESRFPGVPVPHQIMYNMDSMQPIGVVYNHDPGNPTDLGMGTGHRHGPEAQILMQHVWLNKGSLEASYQDH